MWWLRLCEVGNHQVRVSFPSPIPIRSQGCTGKNMPFLPQILEFRGRVMESPDSISGTHEYLKSPFHSWKETENTHTHNCFMGNMSTFPPTPFLLRLHYGTFLPAGSTMLKHSTPSRVPKQEHCSFWLSFISFPQVLSPSCWKDTIAA